MRLGIMQPYLFPYIGYFQLINTVDRFVIHDDVQWIKGGWINRNRILVQGEAQYITLPVKKDSDQLNINRRMLTADSAVQKQKTLRKLEGTYRKAPHFAAVMELVCDCFSFQDENVCAFVAHSLQRCCDYLGIQTPFVFSSTLNKRNDLQAQDRVLDINRTIGATHYINPIGGTELYRKDRFTDHGLCLNFLQPRPVEYRQFAGHAFVPFLSIIDVMMFNTVEEAGGLLQEFDLV